MINLHFLFTLFQIIGTLDYMFHYGDLFIEEKELLTLDDEDDDIDNDGEMEEKDTEDDVYIK